MSIVAKMPASLWLRLAFLFYRVKWRLRPMLRWVGVDLRMSWEEVIFATKLLLPEIGAYNPDIVIGLGIGGAVWGGVLAGSLNDKPLLVLDRIVHRSDGKRDVELVGPSSITANGDLIKGKRVLLVNAEIISAQTTLEAIKLIEPLEPAGIKIAALDYSSDAQRQPDFAYLRNKGRLQKPWRRVPSFPNPDELVRQ